MAIADGVEVARLADKLRNATRSDHAREEAESTYAVRR
jgi:hypothetical protein